VKFVRWMKTTKNKPKLFFLALAYFRSFWLPKITPFKKHPHFRQFFAIKNAPFSFSCRGTCYCVFQKYKILQMRVVVVVAVYK
jgi:hypothetical protein